MKIISLDPGGTTGWAKWTSTVPEAVRHCAEGQMGPLPHHRELYGFLLNEEPTIIVCESFQYRNGLDKAELYSVEYIGVVKLYEQRHPGVIVVWQTAAMGKVTLTSFVKQRHLEKLGLWRPGMKHAMDGYGHLLYYIIHGGNPELKDLRQRILEVGWRS